MISAKAYSPVLYDPAERPGNFHKGTSSHYRYWETQFDRCRDGYTPPGGSHIPGNYYFYLNFCKIRGFDKKTNRKKLMAPLYRDLDHEYFVFVNKARSEGEGVICLKARRKGFSFMNSNILLHEWSFYEEAEVGMGAQKEHYVSDFRKKLLLTYNNIHPQFRNNWLLNNKDLFTSGWKEKENGIWVEKGLGSLSYFRLIEKPDTFRGTSLTWWIVDEAGEVINLKKVYFANEECFREGAHQYGCPIIGGTSNKMSHDSEDFSDMWYNADQYRLRQFFVPASKVYYPFFDESTGKSDMKSAEVEILQRAEDKKSDRAQYFAFKQEMPLTPEDAFVVHGSTPFDLDKINGRIAAMNTHKQLNIGLRGRLEWPEKNGKKQYGKMPEFHEDKLGPMFLVERPLPGKKNAHVSAIDPYHIDDQLEEEGPMSKKNSDGCMYVYRKFIDLETPGEMPVFEYKDRPYTKEEFYENCLKIALYYDTQVLCEYNDDGLLKYFINKGFARLLKLRPRSIDAPLSTATNKYGIHMKDHQKRILTDLVDEYIKRHIDDIYFMGLLKEMAVFGKKNTDRVMAFGMCLLFAEDDKSSVRDSDDMGDDIIAPIYLEQNGTIIASNVESEGDPFGIDSLYE